MKKIILTILSVIGGVAIVPIIIAKIFSWYCQWNGFLLNLVFDTSSWDSEDLVMAKIGLFIIGLLIGLGIIALFSEDKSK